MAFECLTYVKQNGTCYLTLNRPEKLNAISEERGLKATLNWRDARFKDL